MTVHDHSQSFHMQDDDYFRVIIKNCMKIMVFNPFTAYEQNNLVYKYFLRYFAIFFFELAS